MKKEKYMYHLIAILVVGLLMTGFLPGSVFGQVTDVFDTSEGKHAVLYKGDLLTLKVYSLTRIAVTKPGVVTIANADVDEILLIGKKVGSTNMFLWDEHGKRNITIRVLQQDPELIIERIEKMLELSEIEGVTFQPNNLEGKIVVLGEVKPGEAKKLKKILKKHKKHIINLVKVKPEDMIQIDAQISELNTTLSKVFGVDWSTGAEGLIFGYPETLPELDGSVEDLFKIGDFKRTTRITATVNALINEGKGRILSKPSIVVTNGDSASFLVGGEIPVRTVTTSTGGSSIQENITFTSYGISLSVTPTLSKERIRIVMSVSIRDIDAANAVNENVAFTTRSASTKLLLEDGQTIVLAGLIKHNKGKATSWVPVLGKIPVIGALFRSTSFSPDQEQEVVISLTPRVLKFEEENLEDIEDDEDLEYAKRDEPPLLEEDEDDLLMADDFPEFAVERDQTDFDKPETFADKGLEQEIEQRIFTDDMSIKKSKLVEVSQEEGSLPDRDEEELSRWEDLGKDAFIPTLEEDMDIDALLAEDVPAALPEAAIPSDAIASYVQSIQQKIARSIAFPYEAELKGWTGTVTLTLTILSDGTLNEVAVKQSSGHRVFDRDAVNSTQILSPFAPFPPELSLEELVVTIPIVYRQVYGDDMVQGPTVIEAELSAPVLAPPQGLASLQDYRAQVMRKIINEATFPAAAKDLRLEGTVTLNLRIDREGTLRDIAVEESSGHDIFDVTALKVANNAAPYDRFPTEWQKQEVDLTIPVIYKLERE